MKISSNSNMGDIMAVGVNVSEQSKKASDVPDFKSYMQQSSPNQNTRSSQGVLASEMDRKPKSDDTSNVSQSANTDQVKNDDQGQKADSASNSSTEQTNRTTDTKEQDSSTVDGEVSKETMTEYAEVLLSSVPLDQIRDLLQNIQSQIQELLGIDAEQFNHLLDSLNMQLSDLLDSDSQKQFLLAAEDAQPIDLLTNEELVDLLIQMQDMVSETLSASDIEATTLQSALEQVESIGKNVVEQEAATDQNTQTEPSVQSPEKNLQIDFSVEVEVEADASGSQEAFQGEQPDLGAMKEQIIGQLHQTVGQVMENTEAVETVTPSEIVNQVVEQIKLTVRQDTTSMELQLYPEHLGKVAVQVSTRNGAVTAQLTAENEMARAALENSIQSLKEAFQNQGLKVEAVEVMVATSSFAQEQFMNQQKGEEASQSGKGTRRINLDDLDELVEDELLTEAEQLQVDLMRKEGRSVDYTA